MFNINRIVLAINKKYANFIFFILINISFSFRQNDAQRFGAWRSGGLEVQMFKLALMLIEVQMLILALMPPFCQTPVSGSYFCSSFIFSFVFGKSNLILCISASVILPFKLKFPIFIFTNSSGILMSFIKFKCKLSIFLME